MSKDGKLRFRKDRGYWYVDVTYQGKRHFISKYVGVFLCRTEDQGRDLLKDIRKEITLGTFKPERYKKARMLHLSYYSNQWLDTLDVSEATLHDYNNSLKNHILPKLGHWFLPDINTDKLKMFQKEIKREDKGKKNVMDCLKMILRAAKISGYIPEVPEFPKLRIKKTKVRWISDQDAWMIINHIPVKHRPIFIFIKLTGCRPSEARAFRKVDIKADHILFAKTFGRGEILKEVKGYNEEPFPLYGALRELLFSIPANLTQFVFINPDTGRPYTKNINRIWNAACDKAEVMRVQLRLLRHSFGCHLLKEGIDKSVVQRLLRHTDSAMTDRYAEYMTDALTIALDRVIKLPDRNQQVTRKKQGDKTT